MSGGAIAGIVIGSVVLTIFIIVIGLYVNGSCSFCKNKTQNTPGTSTKQLPDIERSETGLVNSDGVGNQPPYN